MWWFFLLPLVAAAPLSNTFHMGQIIEIELVPQTKVTYGSTKTLPDWLLFENGTLYGIAGKAQLGRHTIKTEIAGKTTSRSLVITRDTVNPCGEEKTQWVDVAALGEKATLASKLSVARTLMNISNVAKEEFRVYSAEDEKTLRIREDGEYTPDGVPAYYVTIMTGCDFETAAEIMDTIVESEYENEDFELEQSIFQGRYAPVDKDVETTTQIVERTTRQVKSNNPPVKLNKIDSFTCQKGVYCEAVVAENTFKDVEDGDTFSLKLTVKKISGGDGNIEYANKKLRGVPMTVGTTNYLLEARDSEGQVATAAFQVVVKDSMPNNHLVSMELENYDMNKFVNTPSSLVKLVDQIASALRCKSTDITVRGYSTNENKKTVVEWSSNTVPVKSCSHRTLDTMRQTMFTKSGSKARREFVKALGADLFLSKATMEMVGPCKNEATDAVTTAPTVEAAGESFPWLILIAVLAVLLLLVLILFAVCSAVKKNKKQYLVKDMYPKQAKPSEYMSKGLPVVFPEEVNEDADSHAATPMLAKEERPPLKVSQHENPLYKPPPPMAAPSPRSMTSSGYPKERMPPPYAPP